MTESGMSARLVARKERNRLLIKTDPYLQEEALTSKKGTEEA